MNIYAGNRGLVERIPENMPRISEQRGYALRPTEDIPVRISEDKHEQTELIHKKKPSALSDILGGLGGLGTKLTGAFTDTDEVLLLVFLYLLYRESKDIEFLLIAGAMLLI